MMTVLEYGWPPKADMLDERSLHIQNLKKLNGPNLHRHNRAVRVHIAMTLDDLINFVSFTELWLHVMRKIKKILAM